METLKIAILWVAVVSFVAVASQKIEISSSDNYYRDTFDMCTKFPGMVIMIQTKAKYIKKNSQG